MDLIDFLVNLVDHVNEDLDIPMPLKMGYLGEAESFVIYPTPGSRVTNEFYDGTKDRDLNYDIAMQSKSQELLQEALWRVHNDVENITELPSENGSYDFDEIVVADKPFISQVDEQGWFVFMLSVTAKITTYNKKGSVS